MPGLLQATADYETWLARRIPVVKRDLALKHRLMAKSPFQFLRATFYRWAALWHELCPELARAPRVLAVGDLHIENFGTWRDADGRLVWGVNDVDEAAPMPYAIDLVRLATSALIASADAHLTLPPKSACKAVLRGYRNGLAAGGAAFVLEEEHQELRRLALSADREPVRFWRRLSALRRVPAPASVRRLLIRRLPRPVERLKIAHRIAGLGSLGRPRYTAIALWKGAYVAREIKPLLPSAHGWALGRSSERLYGAKLLSQAVRCPDPFLLFDRDWLSRRLAPHCSRIELAMLPRNRDEQLLLEAMGFETANLHLGSPGARAALMADLRRRGWSWLLEASTRMADATLADWQEWRSRRS